MNAKAYMVTKCILCKILYIGMCENYSYKWKWLECAGTPPEAKDSRPLVAEPPEGEGGDLLNTTFNYVNSIIGKYSINKS